MVGIVGGGWKKYQKLIAGEVAIIGGLEKLSKINSREVGKKIKIYFLLKVFDHIIKMITNCYIRVTFFKFLNKISTKIIVNLSWLKNFAKIIKQGGWNKNVLGGKKSKN